MDVRYGGEPVQGSPFTVNVTDQVQGAQVVNFNQADHRFFENREANIPIKMAEGSSADYLKCRVTDPEMDLLHNELSYDPTTNLYHVRFVPVRPGRHRVDVEYDGVPVEGSPFMLNIEGSEGHKKVFASGDGLKGGKCPGWRGERYSRNFYKVGRVPRFNALPFCVLFSQKSYPFGIPFIYLL